MTYIEFAEKLVMTDHQKHERFPEDYWTRKFEHPDFKGYQIEMEWNSIGKKEISTRFKGEMIGFFDILTCDSQKICDSIFNHKEKAQ